MENGVFTSAALEIAQTGRFSYCLWCSEDKSKLGAKLYMADDINKKLIAICERDLSRKTTVYAFSTPDGQKYGNDGSVLDLLGETYSYSTDGLRKIDDITVCEPYEMPTIEKDGFIRCLKQWQMGSFLNEIYHGINFQMVTNNIEYVFMLRTDGDDIYCGASVNIPFENGLFGGNQYFRLRNFEDNSKPFCRFHSSLGNSIPKITVPELQCASGSCTVTNQGIFWTVKRCSEDEIVLAGCGGDEYRYNRNRPRFEYFAFSD